MLSFKQYLAENTFEREKVISNLENFLQGDLKPYAKIFVDAGMENNIDPYLTASIAMLETGRGTSKVLRKFNNASGAWDPKTRTHKSYSDIRDSIYDQARFLKTGYIDKGLTTIQDIGRKYAPPGASNDPNGTNSQWPQNVASLYSQATGSSNLLAGGTFNGAASNTAGPNSLSTVVEPEDDTLAGATNKIKSGIKDIFSI